MIRLNELAKIERVPESKVAAEYLAKRLSIESGVHVETVAERV